MEYLSSLRDLRGALRRRAWAIVLVCALGIPFVLWFALTRPPAYEATAVIQIEAPLVDAGGDAAALADTQLDLIEQKIMARDRLLDLAARFSLFPELSASERLVQMREAIEIRKLVDPALAWRPETVPSGLSITVELGERQVAADLANALLSEIVAAAQSRREGRTERTLAFFEAEEARLEEELETLEAEFARFQEQNFDSLPTSVSVQRDQLSRLVGQRIDLEQQVIAFETSSDRLRDDETARRRSLLEQQRQLITDNIERIEAALAAAPEAERRYNEFTRRRDQLQQALSAVTERRAEAAMARLLESRDETTRFEILEEAVPPDYASSSSRRKIAAAGGIGVLLAALSLALALEVVNPQIRTAAQLERALGVRPVVVIPEIDRRQARRRARRVRRREAGRFLGIWGRLRGWRRLLPG
ncbi:Wzz/FepE/Etk N-terminal domain-containing protein [Limimaricola litoreus]|uniref:Chain-length determining protein n=1 Tax=Limimaricola litoreus TaxID=2955316 RepID=A0A9X2FN44_9RHOB|nr:Wzz/FepE/Etk N-terminal domain-containing protein [Limimaricola litoreus]MCP1168202.1 chain-length determining protein [Limimaricola litoreus]